MLRINCVSKEYKLGQIGRTTLRAEIQRRRAKFLHQEDPTKKIGAKIYEKGEVFKALDNISFDVRCGERVGIIGHNGAGKSTLLKLISRVTAPTDGEICMNGRVASMLEVGTGFHPELTGRENIYMNGAILGMTKKEIDSKIEDIIDFSECRQFIDTPVKRYSSGMYVKLAFSVAAHLDSEIMIMDEVLAVGDMAFQKKCLDKMNDVSRNDGRTILYVSHNMGTIRQLCDRVVVLSHGRVIFDGDVEEGIAVYAGQNEMIERSLFYEERNHRFPKFKKKVKMESLDILNEDFKRIPRGTDVEFVLHCVALEDLDNIGFRFEFLASNFVQGASFLNATINGKKGEHIDIHATLNTSNFAPSKYIGVGLLFETDSYGNQSFLDRVDPAIIFEVVDDESEIKWITSSWGYTMFNQMEIVND